MVQKKERRNNKTMIQNYKENFHFHDKEIGIRAIAQNSEQTYKKELLKMTTMTQEPKFF